ncbi:hypothetical protein L6R44_20950 [Enterobacter cloacae complex sp. ECC445]|uniref:hypothetical protein n=1 Tax=Enterobacter cloacae complex sp. ECC445 TaxID=2913213 RepID=UPI001F480D45|nr:hypothetical protein [Enterobacter cloacae complex sp. ECC445]MCG0458534.1 hypothetical protein [Enterobacter cloacae complex sp. ECC445]
MTLKTWLLLGVELLLSGIIIFVLLGQISEQRGRAEKAEKEVDGQRQVIATQAFNINRFNQIADYTNRNNSLIDASTDNTVIEYREILRREKTCDLPVPADVAGGLLEYANRLRASAMHPDTSNADAANDSAAAAGTITYCQAVLWIKPLLAVIEKGNNNLAGIRQIEKERQ